MRYSPVGSNTTAKAAQMWVSPAAQNSWQQAAGAACSAALKSGCGVWVYLSSLCLDACRAEQQVACLLPRHCRINTDCLSHHNAGGENKGRLGCLARKCCGHSGWRSSVSSMWPCRKALVKLGQFSRGTNVWATSWQVPAGSGAALVPVVLGGHQDR